MPFTHLNIVQPIELKTTEGYQGRFYHIEDKKYPSVTTILGSEKKLGLEQWRLSMGAAAADKETTRCTDRGTAVHLMIEKWLQNDPNPTLGQQMIHISEFNSLKMHLRKIDNIVLQEGALYSHILKTAGRVDCIAEYNKTLSIIDFKTSTNAKDYEKINDYFLQTTAYAWMFEEIYGIHIDNIVIIMSIEKGIPLVFKEKTEQFLLPLC